MDIITKAARAAHEAIREFNEDHGDFTIDPWEQAAENIKNSAIDGVKHVHENPDVTAKDLHDNWVKFKEADGWKFGPTKDATKKTHPSMVPYDQLSERERMKDEIFISMVKAHLSYSAEGANS